MKILLRVARPGTKPFRTMLLAFLTLVTLGASALVVLPGVTAQAAGPPFIHGDPNPVPLLPGQTSANYTVSWSTGNGQGGSVTVSVNNGAPSGPLPVAPSGANIKPTINDGETHVWKLYGAQGRLLAMDTITTAHRDQSCKEQCIKVVKFVPQGTFADFHIETVKDVNLQLEVHDKKSNKLADQKFKNSIAVWDPTIDNLTPNTDYDYLVTATDAGGNVSTYPGTFTTKHRKVDVNFESITAIDDSDGGGPGDLTFWFRGNGAWDLVNTYGEVSIATGDTAHPNHAETYMDTADTLTVAVYGYDDDCDWGQFCTSFIGPGGSSGGSNDEQDWATAWGSMNVAASGPNEKINGATDFFTVGWSLEFSVHATFSVSYV